MTALATAGDAHLRAYYQQMTRWRADVLADDDPEAIHKMRVAARRLRVVLKTFADCYPKKPRRRLARQVKRLQRALGSARDNDVLLEQLRNESEQAPAGQQPGIRWLINFLQAQRASHFQEVQRRLRKRKMARLRADFQATLRPAAQSRRPAPIPPTEGVAPSPLPPEDSLATRLQSLLLGHLAELRRWSEVARDPDHTQEQHQLRIAAKRLRYTLELFQDVLPRQADELINALSELQDTLGVLHDQIVLRGIIQDALADAQAGAGSSAGGLTGRGEVQHPQRQERAALKRFLGAKAREQQERYTAFLTLWQQWEEQRTLERIEALAWALGPTPAEQQVCGGLNVEDWPHARQVARLAQQLFAATAPLHGLVDTRAAALLERAALLHNAGMLIEKRRHHKHSFTLISAASLPDVSAAERHEIACIARYHRRALPSRRHPEFACLDTAARERVSQLAALVRLADACDYRHDGRVEQVRLELEGDEARLWLVPGPGLHADEEIRQAQAKADLFERAFGRKVQVAEVETESGS